jgi:hypothetical protein
MRKDFDKPLCSNCIHSNPTVYVDLWHQRRPFLRKALDKYMMEKKYKDVHCRMVKADAENFPHKLGELSNWDQELLPQHCGHWEKKPNLLLFQQQTKRWDFIGAYSTPEICKNAESHITRPRVVSSLVEFKETVPKYGLITIADNLPVRIPIIDDDISHDLVWELLQLQLSDEDRFDKINIHDWLRSIFPAKGSTNKWELMVRFGMYKMRSLRTAITDLRSPKYARGPCIDIRPVHPRRNFVAPKLVPLDGQWKHESVLWELKRYVRVK